MNKIYKVIFSRSKGMLVVASELAATVGKSGTKLVVTMIASLAIFATSGAINIASAQVVSGDSLNITGN
ncbi:ESPR domain-containing protein, partial [Oxalobacter sp. OxGP1]|uniref:ESPR domain-containing protein n=1 Tax=Oxalobacter paeniformigenes TaxID=2946594 RepID=UPI0022AF1384